MCGALPSSICADGGGVCDSSGLNLGQANSNLTYSEEQLVLTYSEGKIYKTKKIFFLERKLELTFLNLRFGLKTVIRS